MLIEKAKAVNEFKKILGEENVLTDETSKKEADMYNRGYAKAFDVYATDMPIAVLNVSSVEEISEVLSFCNENKISVIARTGGSSGEALLETINDETVFVDASAMNELIKIDEANNMVTAQCGMPLERLENILREKGLTTGHSPQSLPMAHLGGLVATRSIGQFSSYYGAIEDMVCGLEAVLPSGDVTRVRNVPRRATGPDLKHLFIGSEGALGFITEVTMKLFPYRPENRWMGGYIVENMDKGLKTIADIKSQGYKPSVVRLYDKADYDYNYGSLELEEDKGFMFFVVEGPEKVAQVNGEGIHEISLENGAEYIGTEAVEHWMIHRNDLCDEYGTGEREKKYRQRKTIYETTEISASWTEVRSIYDDVMKNIPAKFENLVFLGGHVSHSYIHGTNIYFVYELKMSSPEVANKEHIEFVHAICEEVIKYETGGTVHHHGMGKHRVAFSKREHGSSFPLLVGLKKMMDPNNIMNPGNLIEVKDL
jgi:alkyldihydroxyacetonephosphate synthase